MPELFFQVVRVFFKGTAETPVPAQSVQYYASYQEAEKRFYVLIAPYITSADSIYHGAYIIDSNGIVREKKVFDRRIFTPPQPEPTPAPTPEPEDEPAEEPEEEIPEE